MDELKEIVSSKPVVLITNEFDPYCLQTKQIFDSLRLHSSVISYYLVDKEKQGQVIEQASLTLSKQHTTNSKKESEEINLPHIYFKGKFFGGHSELEELRKKQVLKYRLMDVGAIKMPDFAPLDLLLKETKAKLVCFLTSYSPYSFRMKEILQEYELGDKLLSYIYVDKQKGGDNLEEAIKYRCETNDLPVLFLSGKPFCNFSKLEKWHAELSLEKRLGDGGLFPAPAVVELETLKANHPLLIVYDQVSPYSLNVVDIVENMSVKTSVKMVCCQESKVDTMQLAKACIYDTKNKLFPYIFLDGKHVITEDFVKWHKDGSLPSRLKAAGAMS